jgi:hypothetical protein
MTKLNGLFLSNLSRGIALLACCAFLALAGCATDAQTGALGGAGAGALMGQLIGHNTKSTLIGTGIGLGLGYIIGNEMDKKKARERSARTKATNYKHDETGDLGGTRWKQTSINPKPKEPESGVVMLEFQRDGQLVTTTTYRDGTVDVEKERYRVVGNTLVINRPGYLINAKYGINGSMLIIDAENYSAVYQRL